MPTSARVRELVFLFNDTATTEISTLSLHDALPSSRGTACAPARRHSPSTGRSCPRRGGRARRCSADYGRRRSEEHTSELQSRQYLVCRLLLEKTKTTPVHATHHPGYQGTRLRRAHV